MDFQIILSEKLINGNQLKKPQLQCILYIVAIFPDIVCL